MKRNSRFKSLYQNTLSNFIESPHIVTGCGSIGGYIIKILGQIGVKQIQLWDHDIIEEANIGPQGFSPTNIGDFKVKIRKEEFDLLNPNAKCNAHNTRFQARYDHGTNAYWWLCVDSLSIRKFIYDTAMTLNPYRIIDTRMGGLNYEIYSALSDIPERYLETILFAMKNPIQESCATKSTPHTAMITASIAINMALSETPPFSVIGNMLNYQQEARWD